MQSSWCFEAIAKLFNKRMKQLVQVVTNSAIRINGSGNFAADGRFHCIRKHTSLKKTPDEVAEIAAKFHKYLLNIQKGGTFQIADIANMDQTPMTVQIIINKRGTENFIEFVR